MLYGLAVLIYLVIQCSALAPTKVESVGRISKYTDPNFILMDDRPQKQFQLFISSANNLILSSFLNHLPKTEKSIQFISLSDRGLYELILLTHPNNFNNKVIIIKPNPIQYAWVNKNLYLNGLEHEQSLYQVVLGDRNRIEILKSSQQNPIDKLFNRKVVCSDCQQSYKIQTNLSYLLDLHSQKEAFKTVHVFMTISSRRQARQLKKQLQMLYQKYASAQVVLEIKKQIAMSGIIPNRQGLKIYSIGLKIGEKATTLQFKIISEQNSDNTKIGLTIYPFTFLDSGVYYITQTEGFLKKQP